MFYSKTELKLTQLTKSMEQYVRCAFANVLVPIERNTLLPRAGFEWTFITLNGNNLYVQELHHPVENERSLLSLTQRSR